MSPTKNKFLFIVGIIALAALLAACGGNTPAAPTSAPAEAATSEPSQFNNASVPFEAVVQIWAGYYDEAGELQIGWTGSGTIISPDGLILTNAHVVLPDRFFPVDELIVAMTITQDQEPEPRFFAEVLQADAALDIAVIRVTHDYDGNPVDGPALNLPHVPLGDSDQLNLGDALTILGYPGIGGATVTLTRGEVSGFTSEPAYGQRAFIKTSATIAGGNSGGLAVDSGGQLIGIPTQLGYGGDDQYVDCRVLADTNRDGVVNDSDSCIPTGGFINALRPVSLALPLIEAAQRGEVSILGAEEPELVSAPQQGGTTVSDDFSDETSGWDIYSIETYASYYSNGEYIIEAIGAGQFFVAEPYLNFDNVEMSVDFRFDQSDDINAINEINFVCRYLDYQNYYEFRVLSDGSVGISKWLGGDYILLADLQPTGAVLGSTMHQGEIKCDGNSLSLRLDGQLVAEATDDSFVSGDVGLAAFNSTEGTTFVAAFDNFQASVPSGGGEEASGQVVFEDDFSDGSTWITDSDTDWSLYYSSDRYFFAVNPPNFSSSSALTDPYENIVINVEVNIEQAGHDGDIGVLCRYVDTNNYYALEVSEDGYYSIWKRVNGEVTYLVEWTLSDLVLADTSSTFILNAACDGAQLSVGINAELLATVTDSDFSSGGVGLIVGTWANGGLVVSFDNYQVIEY